MIGRAARAGERAPLRGAAEYGLFRSDAERARAVAAPMGLPGAGAEARQSGSSADSSASKTGSGVIS